MKCSSENVLYLPRKRVCGLKSVTVQSIRPSEVPVCLRDSEYYRALNTEDGEKFDVPAHLLKDNANVETLQDARHLLNTVRYWGANTSLTPILDFALTQPLAEVEQELRAYENDIPFVKCMLRVLKKTESLEKMIMAVMECGNMDIVRHLDRTAAPQSYSEHVISAAAATGKVELLQLALDKLSNNRISSVGMLYEGAVEKGRTACVKLLEEHPKVSISKFLHTQTLNAAQCGLNLPYVAAANGHLECLQYLHSVGCPLHKCILPAAASGSVGCLKYVVENAETPIPVQLRLQACLAVVERDNADSLQYMHKHGYYLSQNMCIKAASMGALRCVQFFLAHSLLRSFLVCHAAALSGYLNCLQYAHEHRCPLVSRTKNPKTAYSTPFNLNWRPVHLVRLVAQRQHWDCVQYLIVHGHPMTSGLSTYLARYNQNQLMQIAVERGCEIDHQVAMLFAGNGNLHGLMYALEHGCDESCKILCAAASTGTICSCKKGARLRTGVCLAAAESGNLDCLQYAHEQGCPWSAEVRLEAARGGHLHCLQYLREYGCPYDPGFEIYKCNVQGQLYW